MTVRPVENAYTSTFGVMSSEDRVNQMQHNIEVSTQNLQMHQETKNMSHRAINNILFVVSTGTFALSVTFVGNIEEVIRIPWLLIVSWGFFSCSIAANGVSHWFIIQQSAEQISMNNQWRQYKFMIGIEELERNNERLHWIVRSGNRISLFAISSLVAGTVCLTVFVSVNLLAHSDVQKTHESWSGQIQINPPFK